MRSRSLRRSRFDGVSEAFTYAKAWEMHNERPNATVLKITNNAYICTTFPTQFGAITATNDPHPCRW